MARRRRSWPVPWALVLVGLLLSACGNGATASVSATSAAPTTTSPSTTSASSTTTTPAKAPNVPPGGISYAAFNYIVEYIQTGYCTPNDYSMSCEVAESPDQSIAGHLAPGAYRVVGYELCSWAATETNYLCDSSIGEAALVAQAFSTPAAAHEYLEQQSQTGEWGMGWQCNQWAMVVGSLPGGDQSKAQRAMSSAATILNGSSNSDGSAPYAITARSSEPDDPRRPLSTSAKERDLPRAHAEPHRAWAPWFVTIDEG